MLLLDIPYEPQQDRHKCGAAALCMALRSFGLSCTQESLWPHLRPPNPSRYRPGARIGKLVRYALGQGLPAVLLRAGDPWELLGRCLRPELRALVIHRRHLAAEDWHCSVLRGRDEQRVVLHDPMDLPDRTLSRRDFLTLWGPHPLATWVRGHLLVVLARPPADALEPKGVLCPCCGQHFALPADVTEGCGWDELYCPHCHECRPRLGGPEWPASPTHPLEVSPMPTPQQMQDLAAAFERYQVRMQAAQAGATDAVREQLRSLNEKLSGAMKELVSGVDAHNQRVADALRSGQDALKKAEAQAAELLKNAPKPKPIVVKPDRLIDPNLEEKLQRALLSEFGNRKPLPDEEEAEGQAT
jgi:hypothetical protein